MERVFITYRDGSVGEWVSGPGVDMSPDTLKALAETMIKPTPISVDIVGVAETPLPDLTA